MCVCTSEGKKYVCLVDELVPVFYAPFGLMVVLLIFHSCMTSIVSVLWEVGAILGNGQGQGQFKDKIMLHCFRGVEYQQGFTPGIWY